MINDSTMIPSGLARPVASATCRQQGPWPSRPLQCAACHHLHGSHPTQGFAVPLSQCCHRDQKRVSHVSLMGAKSGLDEPYPSLSLGSRYTRAKPVTMTPTSTLLQMHSRGGSSGRRRTQHSALSLTRPCACAAAPGDVGALGEGGAWCGAHCLGAHGCGCPHAVAHRRAIGQAPCAQPSAHHSVVLTAANTTPTLTGALSHCHVPWGGAGRQPVYLAQGSPARPHWPAPASPTAPAWLIMHPHLAPGPPCSAAVSRLRAPHPRYHPLPCRCRPLEELLSFGGTQNGIIAHVTQQVPCPAKFRARGEGHTQCWESHLARRPPPG